MNRYPILLVCFFSFAFPASTQNMAAYTAGWESTLDETKVFNFIVEVGIVSAGNAILKISNTQTFIRHPFSLSPENNFSVSLEDGLSFKGSIHHDKSQITGFIRSGMLLYHIVLYRSHSDKYIGSWNILMVDLLESNTLYLSIENGSDDTFQAYPIFGDNRFTGTWCGNFQKSKDLITFSDFKTGLHFEGLLTPLSILLTIKIGGQEITRAKFKRSQSSWKIGEFNSTNEYKLSGNKWLNVLEDSIYQNRLVNTHAILIAKEGKTIYEKYFNGYNGLVPHDMRSASKSISSAIAGITLDQGLIKNVRQRIEDYLPAVYFNRGDSLKTRITIHDLLTMSSGLDAIDFGINRNSAASEDNYQSSADWAHTVLSAPMIHPPGLHAYYGSANPYLLGLVIDSAVYEPLEDFMDKNLFEPLKITNYIIQTDMHGRPYFGGGMYMTPADMLKFGQLYLNHGTWGNRRILPEEWVKKSFANYLSLENTSDKNGYGYLWWHHSYLLHGRRINSIEARGAGGQYIFVLPELNAVAVVTSGNFRNGKFQQPELILEKYLLPYLMD